MIDEKNAKVWVDEDQRSIAIGKMGQNIALASELTGVSIHIVKPEGEQHFIENSTSQTFDEE